MGRSFCLQPWLSISGNNNWVVQDALDWLDVGAGRDIAVYAEVAFVQNQAAVTEIQVQTSPVREDASFAAGLSTATPYIARYQFSTAPPLGVQPIKIIRWATVTQTAPLSRFVRWRISFPAGDGTIMFRIYLNVTPLRERRAAARIVTPNPPRLVRPRQRAPLPAAPPPPSPGAASTFPGRK